MKRLYTKDHEWLNLEDGIATVGITDFAQAQLGDVVFVELPKPGQRLAAGETASVVESVKAASEVYAPVTGEVVAINEAATANPALINQEADKTWLFKLQVAKPQELDSFLDIAAYNQLIASGDDK